VVDVEALAHAGAHVRRLEQLELDRLGPLLPRTIRPRRLARLVGLRPTLPHVGRPSAPSVAHP